MAYENKLFGRFVAFLIDMIIIYFLQTILINLGISETMVIGDIEYTYLPYFPNLLLLAIYFVGFAVFMDGQTIGKLMLHRKIKKQNLQPLDKNKVIFREIIKVILMPISFISYIVCLIDKDNKSIHDLLMDSVVVKELRNVNYPHSENNDFNQNQQDFGTNDETNIGAYYKDKASEKYIDPLDEDNYKIDDDDYK